MTGLNKAVGRPQKKDEDDETYQEKIAQSRKKLEERNKEIDKLLSDNPILSKYRKGMGRGEKNLLLEEYLKSRGFDSSVISADAYFEKLKNQTSAKGKFNLKEPGAKAELTDIVKKYIGYKSMGGAMKLEYLTDNAEAIRKLQKEYGKLTGTVVETTKAKKDLATESEKIILDSKYEGVSTEELKKKYDKLSQYKENSEKGGLDEYLQGLLDPEKQKKEISSIYDRLNHIKNIEKKGNALKKQGNIDDASEHLNTAKKYRENFIKEFELTEDALKGLTRKSKKQINEMAEQIYSKELAKKELAVVNAEMVRIDKEISLRQKATEAEKQNTEAKKANNKESQEKSSNIGTEKETEKINENTESLKKNTKEKQKNKKHIKFFTEIIVYEEKI